MGWRGGGARVPGDTVEQGGLGSNQVVYWEEGWLLGGAGQPSSSCPLPGGSELEVKGAGVESRGRAGSCSGLGHSSVTAP